MKTFPLPLIATLFALSPLALHADNASTLPQITVQPTPSGSIRNATVHEFRDRFILAGSVTRTPVYAAGIGAHVDVTLMDSRGEILAVIKDTVAFNRHPVTGRHRTSRFAISWAASEYPTLHSIIVRYAAGSHAWCADQKEKQ